MTPTFNKIHNRFKLNGNYFSFDSLKEVAYSYIKEGETFEQEIGVFLLDWLDDNEFLSVNTSGSTGQPKSITLSKQAMVNSAIATGDYFNLKPGNTALLCLPASYIAGKMMLVRALILGLEIDNVQPTTTPKINQNKHYDFCAMIPAQAEKSSDQLDAIKTLIVGGAQVSKALKQQFSGLKTQVFETYGMTETITHIAVKQINNTTTNIFTTLPGIAISQNKKECLVIDAPQLTANQIITNDVVKLHSNTTFEWLGRIDNVINSGGVKLFPEQIEAKLQSKIKGRFFITAQKDDTFGEVPVLVLEAKDNQVNLDTFTDLTNIQTPKVILAINAFAETSSGKVNRLKTMQLLKK